MVPVLWSSGCVCANAHPAAWPLILLPWLNSLDGVFTHGACYRMGLFHPGSRTLFSVCIVRCYAVFSRRDVQVRVKSEKLARSEQANAELSSQLAAERKAAKQAGAAAQRQLLGSMRRLQYMVSMMTGFVLLL